MDIIRPYLAATKADAIFPPLDGLAEYRILLPASGGDYLRDNYILRLCDSRRRYAGACPVFRRSRHSLRRRHGGPSAMPSRVIARQLAVVPTAALSLNDHAVRPSVSGQEERGTIMRISPAFSRGVAIACLCLSAGALQAQHLVRLVSDTVSAGLQGGPGSQSYLVQLQTGFARSGAATIASARDASLAGQLLRRQPARYTAIGVR